MSTVPPPRPSRLRVLGAVSVCLTAGLLLLQLIGHAEEPAPPPTRLAAVAPEAARADGPAPAPTPPPPPKKKRSRIGKVMPIKDFGGY